jgi:hypothetical protein
MPVWVKANEKTSEDGEEVPLIVNLGSAGDPVESFSIGHYDKDRNLYKDEGMGFYLELDRVQWLDESEADQEELWNDILGQLHPYFLKEDYEAFKEKFKGEYTLIQK